MKIKPFKVVVREKHIKRGKPNSSDTCPIALAIREYKHASQDKIVVDPTYANINGHSYIMPKIAREFVDNFDNEQPVKPISFTLIPSELELY